MGLLSNPVMRQKLNYFLDKWGRLLSILGYFGGLVWLMLLASEDFNSKRYISENALLPALVEAKYSQPYFAHEHFEELREICKNSLASERDFIEQKMVSAGLEVFHQNVSCFDGGKSGKNIYGILRSTRSSGVESLVLNVPKRRDCQSNGALALMFSLIDHFKVQNYWAKDVVFLVSEGDSCGVPAWLASYHGGKQGRGIQASELYGYAGKIQAAIVIDFSTDVISGFDVLYEGVNGLEPNLDLLNMAFVVSRSEEIPIKLHNQDAFDDRYVQKGDEFWSCLRTLARSILILASGFPAGEHGFYVRYRIEAVTLRSSPAKEDERVRGFGEIGRTVEGIFRSLNNLQEHLHQSFFMYLLPANNRYISIAMYMPVLGCILIGPLLYAIKLWNQVTEAESSTSKPAPELLVSATAFMVASVGLSHGYRHLLSNLVLRQEAGLSASKETVFNIFLAPVALILSMRLLCKTSNEQEWATRKLLTIFLLILVTGMTSLLNFSLALVVAIPFVPMVLLIDVQSRLARFVSYLLVFLSAPYTVIMVLSALFSVLTGASLEAKTLLARSMQDTSALLKYAFVNSHLDVWTLDIVFLAVLPIWIMCASLVFRRSLSS